MDTSVKIVLLIIAILVLIASIIWSIREKGWEPRIATLLAISGLIYLIIDLQSPDEKLPEKKVNIEASGLVPIAENVGIQNNYYNSNETLQENRAKEEREESLLEKANTLYSAENYDSAYIYYCKLLSLNINKGAYYYLRGNCLYKKGDLNKAIIDYERANELNPIIDDAFFKKGLSMSKLGDNENAVTAFSKAIELDKYNSDYYFNRGLSYRAIEKYEESKNDYLKSVKLNPKNPMYLNSLANIYSVLGDSKQAIANYKKALIYSDIERIPLEFREDIKEFFSYELGTMNYNLGKEYRRIGAYDEAIHYVKEAINIMPKSAPNYFELGVIYEETGKFKEAVTSFNKCLSIDPLFTNAYHSLTIAYLNNGKPKDALLAINKALELKPNEKMYLLQKAKVLIELEEYKSSITLLKSLYSKYTGDFEIAFLYGKELLFNEKFNDAILVFNRCQQIQPNNPEVYYRLGGTYSRMGEYELAVSKFKKSIEIDPNHAPSYWDIFVVYFEKLNRKEEAFPYLVKAAKLGHEDAVKLFEKLESYK